MISEIVSEFVERLAQSGATPEIITLFVTFASRVERDVWRDGRDAKQKTADRARAYRKRKRDGRNVTAMTQKEIPPTPPKEKTLPFLLSSTGEPLTSETSSRERVSVAGRELQKHVEVDFELFYQRYPLHKGRRAAKKAYIAARKRAEHSAIMAGLERYIATQNPEFYCHPATWLNQDRWLDETKSNEPVANGGWRPGLPTTEEILERRRKEREERTKMGKTAPVVEVGLRAREPEQKLVRSETRNGGMASLGGILRQNGMDAVGFERKHEIERSKISNDALSVAGMAADDDGNYPFEGAL